jgi:hypothetical protein
MGKPLMISGANKSTTESNTGVASTSARQAMAPAASRTMALRKSLVNTSVMNRRVGRGMLKMGPDAFDEAATNEFDERRC